MSYVQPKKITKKPKYTIVIPTPEEVSESSDGLAPWVEFKSRIKGRYRRQFISYHTMAKEVLEQTTAMEVLILDAQKLIKEALEDGNENGDMPKLPTFSPEKLDYITRSHEELKVYNSESLPNMMADLVVNWNWANIDGEPIPITADAFLNDLDQIQQPWLGQQVGMIMKGEAAVGNAPSDKK